METNPEERRAALIELAAGAEQKAQGNAQVAAGHARILAAIPRCKAVGIGVTAIADAIGVHRDTIYDWTKGEGN